MSIDPIREFIDDQGYLLLDGGLATELEAQGHDLNHRLWSARLLAESPKAIERAHMAFLNAGANCLISSSYQATPQGLIQAGFTHREATRLIELSHQLAQDSCERFLKVTEGSKRRPIVAASIGPYGAYLADGSEYHGNYGLSVAELVAFHRERFEILARRADLLAIETIPSLEEAAALRELLMEDGSVPAWVSFICRDGEHLASGQSVREAAALMKDVPSVLAVGANCTEPRHVLSLIAGIKVSCPSKEIVVYPNSGESYCARSKSWIEGTREEGIAQLASAWHAAGARLIGGCCRVSAKDLAEMGQQLRG